MKAALLHACTLLLCLPVAAIEKEVPPKIREGSTTQKPSTESPRSTESPKPAMKDGEREGGSKPNIERDGEKKPGIRDGEKPRTGPRDGEGMKKPGTKDGEGRKPSAESGSKSRKVDGDRISDSSDEVIIMIVSADGENILIGDEKVPTNRLRGFLSTYLPDHPGAKVIVRGDANSPYKSLLQVLDAISDNGNKKARIEEK
ncbi:MAG: biopolymer transporter ExbD [Verrucomicrobiaceae bacterium]|nr:biopolymer transporter ExbD [Verrucomicrobiaceae bacterium]